MNILNATVLDSYDDNGQLTGIKQSQFGFDIPATTIFANKWRASFGDFNALQGTGSYTTHPHQPGYNFTITPDEGYSTAAEAYKWNRDNPDAVASDGKLSKHIIEDVLFFDTEEPWSENNVVQVVVVWKDDFVYPAPTVDNPSGYPVYKVMVDIMDDPGAQLFGIRFVNLCIVNDFADAVWCTKGGQPSGSGINDMADNYLYQSGWTDAFKTKRPLKYRGEVEHLYSTVSGDLDIEGVTFTPAEDYLGETVKYFDTRDLHLDNNSEHVPSESAYGVSSENLAGANGFQNLSRKDVIYAGLHVKSGEPQKVGTIRLKLNQDLYIPKSKDGEPFVNTIGVDDFREGFIANMGRVNGWAGKWLFWQLDPERVMTWIGLGTSNPVIGWGRVDNPHGNIATGRVDPSSTDVTDVNDFQYSAGQNENMGNWATFYETDQAHRPMVPDFSPPHVIQMRDYMTQNDEQRPNLYGTYNETFGSQTGDIFGAPLANNYLLSQAAYNSGDMFLHGQDINQYISDVFDTSGVNIDDNLLEVYRSISYWSDAVYTQLDLYPWAFFPTFGNGSGRFYAQDSNPTNGDEAINYISASTGKFSGHGKFSLENFNLVSWAPPNWIQNGIINDPNNSLASHGTGMGALDTPASAGSISNIASVNLNFPNTLNGFQATTTALENYYREVEFDIYYTDDANDVQFDIEANPLNGFQPDGTPGITMNTINPSGPPLFEGFTAGVSPNIKWDYLPWQQVINIGGNVSGVLQEGRSGSRRRHAKDFTNVPQVKNGLKNRFEIKEVNLVLGSTNGSSFEHIISPGGINRETDATVEVIGDPGAEFIILFKEVRSLETFTQSDGTEGIRSSGTEDHLDVLLDGGLIPIVEVNIEDITKPFRIGPSGVKIVKLPNVEPLSQTTGFKEFALEVKPYVEEEVIEEVVEEEVIEEEELQPYLVCDGRLDGEPSSLALHLWEEYGEEAGNIHHVQYNPSQHTSAFNNYWDGQMGHCEGKLHIVYPPGTYTPPAPRSSRNLSPPTVISSKASTPGNKLIAPNSSRSKLHYVLKQYPYVDIEISGNINNLGGGISYDPGYNVSDIPHFGLIGSKKVGKAFGLTSEMTFIQESQKNISFEIRLHKGGAAFAIKPQYLRPVVKLENVTYTSGSTTINHRAVDNIEVGMIIEGIDIPTGASVVSITDSKSFEISVNTTGSISNGDAELFYAGHISPDVFEAKYPDNGEIVEFHDLKAHIGRGLSDTSSEYATLVGKIRYVQFGEQRQVFTVDFSNIFTV